MLSFFIGESEILTGQKSKWVVLSVSTVGNYIDNLNPTACNNVLWIPGTVLDNIGSI